MKTLLLLCTSVGLVLVGALGGCGKGGASPGQCGDAIAKGVDSMMATSKKRMETMNAPPEMKAKLDEAAVKLKEVIVKRCVDDKWGKDVIDCYAGATSREELKACRGKLPEAQGQKLQADEMGVMSSMMGGMRPGTMHSGSGMMGATPMGGAAGSGMAGAPPPAGSGISPLGSEPAR